MSPDPVTRFSPWQSEAEFKQLYDRLRAIAHARMAGNSGHTLTPTGLVNEAMVKLLDSKTEKLYRDEAHFLATACTAMRHILVDHARRKSAYKRSNGGENADPSGWPEHDLWSQRRIQLSPEAILDVSRELDRLSESDLEKAQLIELRAFAGLTFPEIGALMGLETKTAERRWRFAAAELRIRLQGTGA
jgi:RNA polymerase sigma factor (TIGR02999 family)